MLIPAILDALSGVGTTPGVADVLGGAARGLAWGIGQMLGAVPPADAGAAGSALEAAGGSISTPPAEGALAGAAEAARPNRLVLYGVFSAIIVGLLTLDLLVFHRKAHEVKFKEAIAWTSVWIAMACGFVVPLYFMYDAHFFDLGLNVPVMGEPGVTKTVSGWGAVGEYFTGYVIELSLSMDNLFVMAVIFGSLRVPRQNQHRVLFWGILGAIIMRGLMIGLGVALIERFGWIIYVFGGLLIVTAIKMAITKEGHEEQTLGPVARLLARFFPISERFEGERFFIRIDGKRFATPLFVALVSIEFTDLIFAVDSIPAIFAITADPFIVFTSNIMAILGLRSMYSCLSVMLHTFRFLKPALVVVLLFIGIKMCLIHTPLKIPSELSLGIVLGILATGVMASLLAPNAKRPVETPSAPEPPGKRPTGEGGSEQGWDA